MARVLVVEDDPAIRQMLTFALELEGHVVEALGDGEQVVPTLAAAPERVVVLLDLMMPRVTGWEVCERLGADPALAARHAVVIMSAGLTPEQRLPDVVRAALLKPFNLITALGLVERLAAEQVPDLCDVEASANETPAHV
ncbi:MAG TPA: response regulator [Ktedonobacterales bacterium]